MRIALLAVATLVLAGCGAATPAAAPPPPAAPVPRAVASPRVTARPAGRVLRVGALPDALAADPRAHELAVAVHDPSRLLLLDARSGRVKQRVAVPVGDPARAATPAVFLIPAETGAHALAITPADHTGATTRPPSAAAVLGRTFVTAGDHVTVLDRGRPTTRFGGAPTTLAAADFNRSLAVLSGRRLELYDPRTLRRTASVPAGRGPTNLAALDDDLYVADTTGGAVLTFSTRPRLHLVARLAMAGGPYAIAADPIHRILGVTLTAINGLTLIALTDPTHRRTLPTIRQPDTLAIDSSTDTIAVASPASGLLQLIRSDERPDAEPARHARSGG
jgi:hypothetical protein